MTKSQSFFFRFLLFLAGAGIIALAFFLFRGDRELTRTDGFIWTSISLMYLIFFLPFFFSVIRTGNFSGKIPSLSLIWIGIFIYIPASVLIILLIVKLSFNIAVIIQSILLFLFLVTVYFAYFASSHAGGVASEEAAKQQNLNRIKPQARSLLLSVDKLPPEYEAVQKTLKQAIEEINYIYPVDGGAGEELETQITRSLNILSEICGGIASGARSESLKPEAEKLKMLVKERKLLRN